MSLTFIIQYKENIKITFLNIKEQTVSELKFQVSKYYSLKDEEYHLLDLGRIVSIDEKLIDMTRNAFTLFFI